MSVDAACTACCCDVPPPVCCFPDASKPLELNFSFRWSVYAGTTEVSMTLLSGQVSTTMTRYGVGIPPNNSFEMRSTGGSLSLRYETFSKVAKYPQPGDSCPGFPNNYYCPAPNDFVHCQSYLFTYNGGLPNDSVTIRCVDPCDPFQGTRKTFILDGYSLPDSIVGNYIEQFGNNEPNSPCGTPLSNSGTVTLLGALGGNQFMPRVIGREGCLGSSTFQNGFVGQDSIGSPNEFDGPCAPNPAYSATIDCQQWRTNPSYVIPSRMGYSVVSCPVLRCNPYGGGNPPECLLFDCFGNVINYVVHGCDTIYPGNNQGTSGEISVRAEGTMSVSVVYG